MRRPKPWYRAATTSWYVEIDGKQEPLGKHPSTAPPAKRGKDGWNAPDEVLRVFHRLMATEQPGPGGGKLLAVQVCDLFLQWSERHNESVTFDWYKHFLGSFCEFKRTGHLTVADLKPFHVTRWLDGNPTWTGARRSAIEVVKRAFSWAAAEGLIPASPFKGVKKPRGKHRDMVLTPEARAQIRAAVTDDRFRDFLTALQETGCRPGEVARVTAADVDLTAGVWVLAKHKTARKTGKPRVVYLTPTMMALTERLVATNPEGPLFRGRRGRPFSKNAIRCRFRRLRAKLPHLGHFISYTFRATYATDALENGVGVAQVAELLGHTSTDMVMRHYGKLGQKVQHMRAMAAKAAGASTAV